MMKNNFELISLTVEAKGEVLSSNLDQFRDAVTAALATINRDLVTDEDFEQAEEDVKGLKNAENVVKEAKEKALRDAEELHTLFSALDESSAEVKKVRGELEKLIKDRKEARKAELIKSAKERLICADRLKDSSFDGIFKSAISGKRSVDMMEKALDIAVATGNKLINDSRKIIVAYSAKHGVDLVPDKDELEVRDSKIVEAELIRRVEARAAAAERKRLEEEVATAKAEVDRAKRAAMASAAPAAPPLPPPPGDRLPVDDDIPPFYGNNNDYLETEEWASFKQAVIAAFGSLRTARAQLTFRRNAERAEKFAIAVGGAWTEANRETEVAK